MKNIEKRLFELFRGLLIQPATKGYEYAKEAVIMKITAEERGEAIKIGDIYKAIAENKGISYNAVERAIRYIKLKCFDNPKARSMTLKVFGNVTAHRYSNNDFICSIFEYLKCNDSVEIAVIDTEEGADNNG